MSTSPSSQIAAYEIPLAATAQQFNITLLGTQYKFQVVYRQVDAASSNWTLEMFTSSGLSITGILPLVTGVDLLSQLGFLGLGFGLYVLSDGGDLLAPPTYENLGTTCHLIFAAYP
jgi:hypothetical protein